MKIFHLPWPPSVNHYWNHWRGRATISEQGRDFRAQVMASILQDGRPRKMMGRLSVILEVHPPDKRKRDLDNLQKGILDALAHAGVYEDDSQIDDIRVKRCPIEPDGSVIVTVEEIQADAA